MVFRSLRKSPDLVDRTEVRWSSADHPEAYAESAAVSGKPEPLTASLASAVNFLAGAWLLLAPFVLGFGATGGLIEGYWNEIVVGLVVASLAVVRSFAPAEVMWFSVLNAVLGLWMTAAPFALGYQGEDAVAATVVDVSAGVVIVAMATTSAVSTYRSRRRPAR